MRREENSTWISMERSAAEVGGRLGGLWEIMDRHDGSDLRLTELLQSYGRCVHFGGMDGTGRLRNS